MTVKTTTLLMSLSILASITASATPVPDRWLDAIQKVETGGDGDPDSALGDGKKARGRFQFHKSAWSDCSKLRKEMGLPVYPYSKAHDRRIATEYARTWLTALRERLSAQIGRPAMAHETWLAFNLGWAGFSRHMFQTALVTDDHRYNKAIQIYNEVYAAKLSKRK